MHDWSQHSKRIGEALRSDTGGDLLPSLSLVEAEIVSATVLQVLRAQCTSIAQAFADDFRSRVSLVAFGSLGRGEFDLHYLVAFQSAEERERIWPEFIAHPAWQAEKAAWTDGPSYETTKATVMTPMDYSPAG